MQSETIIKSFKNKPNFLHTIFGAIITGYLILLFLLYRIDTTIIVSVVAFDFLFVSLVFPLKGALFSKIVLLLTGNLTGFAWNLLQFQLIGATAHFLGDAFSVAFSLFSPIINCIWIVAFWSLGLSIFARENLKK